MRINLENPEIALININYIDNNKNASYPYCSTDASFRGRCVARKLEYNIYNYAFEKLSLNKP